MKVDENGKEIYDSDFYKDTLELKPLATVSRVIDEDILDKVKNIINGDRLDCYGPPKESFQRIADYWNIYLSHKKDNIITPKDAAMMEVLFKLAREENKHKEDNIVDMLAYILLYDKVRE